MDLTFERGNLKEPKGHALLYFRSSADPEEVWGSYLIILPISVDVAKYVPPFLMNEVGELGPQDLSAFAFPPAPEKLDSHAFITKLASMRDDDILFCGTINPSDVSSAMMAVHEAVQEYAERYSTLAELQHPKAPKSDHGESELGVNEVLYGLMSDKDKLSELTRLVGRLRFASEGREDSLANEAAADIHLLARHLPENHKASRLVETAKTSGNEGAKLADLYLQRCFHLILEEYVKLGQVESEIRDLEAESPAPS